MRTKKLFLLLSFPPLRLHSPPQRLPPWFTFYPGSQIGCPPVRWPLSRFLALQRRSMAFYYTLHAAISTATRRML